MKKNYAGTPLFKLIDQKKFNTLADKWNVDKGVRGLTTWELTNALISCFVLHLGSYRDVESTLGIPDSTFGDAIRNRNSGFFQELCDLILLEIRAKTECRKIKKVIRQILAIDSTEIKVHGSLFMEVCLLNLDGSKNTAKVSIGPQLSCMLFGMSMASGSMILSSHQDVEVTLR